MAVGYKITESPGGAYSHAVYRLQKGFFTRRWIFLQGFHGRDEAITYIQQDAVTRRPVAEYFNDDGSITTWAD